MLTNVVYVDPSIAVPGDGSSPATALANLPECAAMSNDKTYLIRRTSGACYLRYNAQNTEVNKVEIVGYPTVTDARYDEMPAAAKTAWDADVITNRPVIRIPSGVTYNLTQCTYFDLYNVDLVREVAMTYQSSYDYGFYLSGTGAKTILIRNSRFAGLDEPIDSASFTTTPTADKSGHYFCTNNGSIKSITFTGNTVCLAGAMSSYDMHAFLFNIESANTGDINISNNTYWGVTHDNDYYSSRGYQFILIYGQGNYAISTGANFRIANNTCYIRKTTGSDYPGLININHITSFGDFYVNNLTYQDSLTHPDFGTPTQLKLDSSVLKTHETFYSSYQEYYYRCKRNLRYVSNITVNLPGLYYLNDHVIRIPNVGTISNITINLATSNEAKVGTEVKTVSQSSSTGYYNGNSYAALAVEGIVANPATLTNINVNLPVGKDMACEFIGVVGTFTTINGRIYAENCELDIGTLKYLEPCVVDSPGGNYTYYVSAIIYTGYNTTIKVANLILSAEPNFAVNGARAIYCKNEYSCDSSSVFVGTSNYKTWGGTGMYPTSSSAKTNTDTYNHLCGIIVNNDGDPGYFQAYDSIHISRSNSIFRAGSTAARSILYTGVSNNSDHVQCYQWIGNSSGKVVVGRDVTVGEHIVTYYALISGITLAEINDYLRIEIYRSTGEFVTLTPSADLSTWVGAPSGAIAIKLSGKIVNPSAGDLYARIRMRGYEKSIYLDPIAIVL